MSSIRLYILGALADEGDMHGHQLKQLAEKEHVDEWTDITVGALYGAIKRLAAEGLIEEVRVEREGAYPERQVWTITHAGRIALGTLSYDGITEILSRADPFDLALSRFGSDQYEQLPQLIAARLARMRAALATKEAHTASITQYLTPLEEFVMSHRVARLKADIAWHEQLVERLPDLLASQPSRKDM